MGKRGPKPKSNADKELSGDQRFERDETHKPIGVIPAPPEYLSDGAKVIFNRICQILHSAGRLTDADLHSVELYADTFEQWVLAIKRREKNKTEKGEYRPTDIKCVRELSSDCNRWSRVLGIGPTYRAGLVGHFGLGGDETNSDVDDPIILGICGA